MGPGTSYWNSAPGKIYNNPFRKVRKVFLLLTQGSHYFINLFSIYCLHFAFKINLHVINLTVSRDSAHKNDAVVKSKTNVCQHLHG